MIGPKTSWRSLEEIGNYGKSPAGCLTLKSIKAGKCRSIVHAFCLLHFSLFRLSFRFISNMRTYDVKWNLMMRKSITPSKKLLFRNSDALTDGRHHENHCIKLSSQLRKEHSTCSSTFLLVNDIDQGIY